MRISKEPEIRKREIIDTAMHLFSIKGYDATSMVDIAREMNVVPGLCYRYFKSKQDLFETALLIYAKECSAYIIDIFKQEGMKLDDYLKLLEDSFIKTDTQEKYHEFFHKTENNIFHKQLEEAMITEVLPHIKNLLILSKERKEINVNDIDATAKFILYGQMPIINDDTISTREKIRKIYEIIKKILS